MKAIVFTKYGSPDILEFKEVAKPAPEEDEVLVKVHAASVNYVDWQVLNGKSLLLRVMNGLLKPKKQGLGDDIAGVVEEVGKNADIFHPGDEVYGISDSVAFAEYACVPEQSFALKPASMTFKQAAAVPEAGITALQGLRDRGKIQAGQQVLIIGASGGVGTFAVQIAKAFGAEVTGVCSSGKLELVRSIGADHVINYTKEDFTKNGQHYDLIFAVGGNHSIFDYHRALNPEGIFICAGGSQSQYFQGLLLGPIISIMGRKKMGSMFANPKRADYVFLTDLIEAGKVVPVIDRIYPLSEVPEALRYYGEGNAQGKLVITVVDSSKSE